MTFKDGQINIISDIPVIPNRDKVLIRLGYRKGKTVIDDEQLELFEEGVQRAIKLSKPISVFSIHKISKHTEDAVTLENGLILRSTGLAKLLVNSKDIVFVGATVGKEVTDEIAREMDMTAGDPALGIIIDAAASYIADAAIDWTMKYVNDILKDGNKKLTKHRYSPGFRDFNLSAQKDIFHLLKLNEIGLSITESFMLVPQKSVIALAGISETRA